LGKKKTVWNKLADATYKESPLLTQRDVAFTLTLVLVLVTVRVICVSEVRMSGAFTVTHTSTNTYNSVAIKNLAKSVKYLEFTYINSKFTPLSPVMFYVAAYIKITSYVYCVPYK